MTKNWAGLQLAKTAFAVQHTTGQNSFCRGFKCRVFLEMKSSQTCFTNNSTINPGHCPRTLYLQRIGNAAFHEAKLCTVVCE